MNYPVSECTNRESSVTPLPNVLRWHCDGHLLKSLRDDLKQRIWNTNLNPNPNPNPHNFEQIEAYELNISRRHDFINLTSNFSTAMSLQSWPNGQWSGSKVICDPHSFYPISLIIIDIVIIIDFVTIIVIVTTSRLE